MALLGLSLDDVIAGDHPIRVIDAFVESLDLVQLGFTKAVAEATGRPPYDPADLLKLYIYGYTNKVRSSRGLEREARRNIEVQWLIDRLTPSFKTIADFRKDHAEAIVGVWEAMCRFCRERSLYGGELVAVDGTKIEAVASRKTVITPQSLAKRADAIERKIAGYLEAMDEADREEAADEPMSGADVAAALEALREQREEVRRQAEHLASHGLKQQVVGESEARLMRTARHGHQVAYNAQSVVDAEHKLIAAVDLTNESNDHRLLHPMAVRGRDAVRDADAPDRDDEALLTVVADSGYSSGEQGRLCEDDGITAAVPRAQTPNTRGTGFFPREAFTYDAESDTWACPAGQTLRCVSTSQTEQRKRYQTKACPECPLKPQCTEAAQRTIIRHAHEDARETMHQRTIADPELMKRRRCLVEHPFGTMKGMMGHPRFLVRGIRKAKAELALTAFGYNLKRVINILTVPTLLAALQPETA